MENQQKFFDKMTKIENETDDSLSKLVTEELRKLREQIQTNSAIFDKKLQNIQSEVNVDKIMKKIDKRMSKEEA